ncbi:uncharacterized protein LOC101860941 [Aplysia californica]|uniref:Mitochondrial fission factor n=1 Tax=Aplysia californica TaxID=6500 RepID=A0ABM0KA44_APLCA|nr:uncharacterized protein LOC101860941 [Aplysia californica]
MTDMDSEGSIKLPDHSLPSDYSDVQPHSYDPDYISQISSKMQVPHRIAVGSGATSRDVQMNGSYEGGQQYAGMSVPDKIIVAVESGEEIQSLGAAEEIQRLVEESSCKFPDMRIPYTLVVGGDNQHIGMRQDLTLDVGPSSQVSSESLSYVGLMTPPRVLTLEETFPSVEEMEERGGEVVGSAGDALRMAALNGQVGGPLPYDPGVNLQDSVLLNEEDEATLLRTQVAKLTRRVQVIEQENQKRAHREIVAYPIILGYFLWKILSWFTRDR